MAQKTGTAILALARIYAQDNDVASNYAVSPGDALILLNDVLMRYTTHVTAKDKYIGASVTGLTFSSGDVYKETGDNTGSTLRISEFAAFHPAGSSTLGLPVAPALERVTVEVIQEMLGYDGDNALAAAASEWTHVAAEKVQGVSASEEKWKVWAYPVINRTRSLTVKASVYTQLSQISDTPDLNEVEANHVARLLAWEMARLKKESNPAFLDSILAPVPKEVVQQMQGGAIAASLAQDRVEWRDW